MTMPLETILGYALAVIGIIATIITYYRGQIKAMKAAREQRERELRSRMQAEYNGHYIMARAVARLRDFVHQNRDKISSGEAAVLAELTQRAIAETEVVVGATDTARSNIIAFARENLSFEVSYEHPAYPGVSQPDEVKFGLPPSAHKKAVEGKSQQIEDRTEGAKK